MEGVSNQTVAHGVQASQPRLTHTFAADRESPFMKAGYGKTVCPVCAADGGKLFVGRPLRPQRWQGHEQRGPARGVAVGAKGGGQGERAPAKHAPDTGTGARGTGAGARTASRKATEEGEVHCTPPPHQHRLPTDGVLRAQTRCRLRGGWTDVADLRSRP